ncbi:MAG: ABC transporter permease [Burkholderiales bacterium]|nr:ABC transporter permease [Pseudomonadota bacterium]MCC7068202.1 ABC transporter permease [Burkholderiales bacterium]
MTVASISPNAAPIGIERSPGLWSLAWKRLLGNGVAVVSMIVVALFLLLSLATAFGWIAADWNREVAVNYAPPTWFKDSHVNAIEAAGATKAPDAGPALDGAAQRAEVPNERDLLRDTIAELKRQLGQGGATADSGVTIVDPLADVMTELRKQLARGDGAAAKPTGAEPKLESLPFGADKWGRDVLKKVIQGSKTSILVGFAAALVATLLGTVLGAYAGYYGGKTDDALNWFYSIFSSIPYILLVLAIAAVLKQKGVLTVVLILGLTGWTSIFRLVRAEYLKHKARDYVRAANAIGASNRRRMFVHIFPNISHVVLVQLSLHVVLFIKSEVILSFLGFGVPVDTVSWGSMLNEAQNELILGYWWQLAAATAFMAVLVTAFSLFTDDLRDALDPKLK